MNDWCMCLFFHTLWILHEAAFPSLFLSFFPQKSTGPESLAGHPGQECLNFSKICFHFQGVSAWHSCCGVHSLALFSPLLAMVGGCWRGNTHKTPFTDSVSVNYIMGPSLRLSKRFQKLPPIMISTENFFFGEAQKDHSAYRISAASSAATSPPPWAQNKNGQSISGACGHKSLQNCEKIAHIKCLKCKSDKSDKSHKILATSDT